MRKLILVAALVGCGGGGSNGSPVAIGDFPSSYVAAYCDYLANCGEVSDQATCEIIFGKEFDFTNLVAAVNAGKVTYSSSQAGMCFAAIPSLSCDQASLDSRNEPTACSAVFTGSGATGAACEVGSECASGGCTQTCSSGSSTTCCPGTCDGAAAAIGASCQTTNGCVTGAYCGSGSTCVALGTAGSACDGDNNECAADLGCQASSSTSGSYTCVATAGEGSDCTSAPCAELGDNCNATTKKCTKRVGVGAVCAAAGDCFGDLVCDATSLKCAALPKLGQPCTDVGCGDSSFCQLGSGSDAGTCTAPLANGGACTDNSNCTSRYCDQSTSGTGSGACAAETTCI